jgi:hypothetical protein
VSTMCKSFLAAVLVLALVQAPLQAAPATPVASAFGVVLQADRAVVGDNSAASGASIFDGDALITDSAGSLRARFGASQAYLPSKSSAVMHPLVGGFSASLVTGTIVLTSAPGETFRLLADGAVIRPKSAEPAVAQVSLISARELILTSRKGELEVAAEGQVQSIPEGTSYRMVIEPADPGAPQGTAGAGSNRNKVIFIVIAAAAVAAAVGLVIALESPSKP